MKLLIRLLCLASLAFPGWLAAHPGSESFMTLEVSGEHLEGELKIKLLDLRRAFEMDADGDGLISWPEIKQRKSEIEDYEQARLRVLINGEELPLRFQRFRYGTQDGEDVIASQFAVDAPEPIRQLDIGYALFFDIDLQHESFARIVWEGSPGREAVFSVGSAYQSFSGSAEAARGFLQFLRSGIWHIWIGYDHILFLIALLIPAVYQRRGRGREPVARLAPALWRVTAIVSAFTLAHSITLSCAMLGWIELPGRLVESAIAVSVFLAALNNFLPTTAGGRGAWLAFAFGLLHGFGFAGVLGELDLGVGQLWRPLLGFNLGVEVGQLAIVAVYFPLAYWLRRTRFYRLGVLYAGSAAVCLCALFWFFQRAL